MCSLASPLQPAHISDFVKLSAYSLCVPGHLPLMERGKKKKNMAFIMFIY